MIRVNPDGSVSVGMLGDKAAVKTAATPKQEKPVAKKPKK